MNQTIDHRQFHRLTVFVAIVEQGSMTRAARVLGLSKGVVSGHLRELERELGVRLLERTTRRMAITATGQDVYKAALRMQSAGRDVLAAAEAASGAVAGRVRISGPFDLAATLLAPAVARVRKAHPELRIDIEVGDIALDLVRDEVDIAVRVGVPVD
ncbi:MAG: LysR family transcriptional regulator, partial [Myxococcota bacterium]